MHSRFVICYLLFTSLGYLLPDRGDLVGAERELRAALKIAPNYRNAREATLSTLHRTNSQ
jgi:hypothetical protein